MQVNILWADDEIDLLRPHVMFLQEKGYTVDTVNNGLDAVEKVGAKEYDIVFLDENMPGLSGLETLSRVKGLRPQTPVVMITKSEEEHIMEEAIGSKISDYLIKPVNPNQILLALKKHLDGKRLVSEKTNTSYQQNFGRLGMRLSDRLNAADWITLYDELVRWELELSANPDQSMAEILRSQWAEANDLSRRDYLDPDGATQLARSATVITDELTTPPKPTARPATSHPCSRSPRNTVARSATSAWHIRYPRRTFISTRRGLPEQALWTGGNSLMHYWFCADDQQGQPAPRCNPRP